MAVRNREHYNNEEWWQLEGFTSLAIRGSKSHNGNVRVRLKRMNYDKNGNSNHFNALVPALNFLILFTIDHPSSYHTLRKL